jgi:hypothetical protein
MNNHVSKDKTSLEFKVFATETNEQDVAGIYTLNDKPLIIYDNGRLHDVQKKYTKSELKETLPLQTDDALIKVTYLTRGIRPRLYL